MIVRSAHYLSANGLDRGRYSGFGVDAGVLRRDAKEVLFEHRPEINSQPGGMQLASRARVIDFGFAQTDGGFRLQRADDGFRLTPLPDSSEFTATLNLEDLGLEPTQRIAAVVARDQDSTEWWTHPHEKTETTLTIKHDPKVFTYGLLVKTSRPSAPPAESEAPKAPSKPGLR